MSREARRGKGPGKAAGANPWDRRSLTCLRNGKRPVWLSLLNNREEGVGKVNRTAS